MKKEIRNIRFCDDSRTILYDILYYEPNCVTRRCDNQRTTQLTPKEYFKRKLIGK